MEVRNQVIFLT